jgi:hypothetical protein
MFGDQYRRYRTQAGMLLPKLRLSRQRNRAQHVS